MNIFENIDCMEGMKRYPDKYFELAIVDPPYGINWTAQITYSEKQKENQIKAGYLIHKVKDWDKKRPGKTYWRQLFRISKNQIVFGANYFVKDLPISRGWFIWDKDQDNFTSINNELGWTSFDRKIETFRRVNGLDKGFMNKDGGGIHPTEKPVALYKWLLTKYAKPGDKILDTHVGSASSLIACEDMGFDYVGFEIDKDYFDAACKRLGNFRKQMKLFEP